MITLTLSFIALFIISITMLARANDLRIRAGFHWNLRLAGFVLAGFAPWGLILIDWVHGRTPTIFSTIFNLGLMLVFVTTPYLPPWWKWIWKGDESGHDRRESDRAQ